MVRPGPCAEWALRGLHPVFADLVRWGCFCITSFFILLSPPLHTLSPSLCFCLSPSLVMLIAPKVRASAVLPPNTPPPPLPPSAPAPRFEWHVLIRPNLIGRRCLGWIGTALYSPLLLMCVDVCMCVRVRVMHVRL